LPHPLLPVLYGEKVPDRADEGQRHNRKSPSPVTEPVLGLALPVPGMTPSPREKRGEGRTHFI
jgi:hypothetical protein